MRALNAQFAAGRPSNDLASAGILVRQIDGLDDSNNHRPWLPCSANAWCASLADRWAASIISAKSRRVYYNTEAGFVLSSTIARLFCAYPGDGNSVLIKCSPLGGGPDATTLMATQGGNQVVDGGSGCIPGCHASLGRQGACPSWQQCDYPPERLGDALRSQAAHPLERHNEIVVDLRSIVDGLPNSIVAVFYMPDGAQEGGEWGTPGNRGKAQQVYWDFLRTYGLSQATFPFVKFDPREPREVFSLE